VLAESVAEEYGGEGVRANAVLPGTMDTPANRRSMPDADASKWTSPAEVARVILFLASAESAPVNGAAVPVYGRS
jgi:NAD(P)-dependent dehydrogenase (short-subunit alcohol dehydrogenase family)